MLRRRRLFFSRSQRAQEGALAIEFALIAPVVIIVLMGIVEFGLILFATTVLEGATSTGARLGKSGNAPSGMTREQYIRAQIQQMSGGLLNANQITITTKPYPTYSTSGNPPPEPCITATCGGGSPGVDYSDLNGNLTYDAVRTDAGLAGDVVVYQSSYPWPIKTPLLAQIIGHSNGIFTITAVSTVRNEPF